ncbi:ubiquitin-related modifier 1 homolog [Convolutriloba macropyga]|uniref:ubiquitin-related modifier 1 homolog n=1 Tax=Convolutriloba macropyga TaxID=536237 RepID=UPI003F51AE31
MSGDGSSVPNGIHDEAQSFIPKVSIELSGGAQFLFGNQTKFDLLDEIKEGTTVAELIQWLTANKLQEREELFVKGDSVRPGLLVLINDADWELIGEKNYVLKSGDNVHFLSTLHGG